MNKFYNSLLVAVLSLAAHGLMGSEKSFAQNATKKVVQFYVGLYAAGAGVATSTVALLSDTRLRYSIGALKSANFKMFKAVTKTTPIAGAAVLSTVIVHNHIQEELAKQK